MFPAAEGEATAVVSAEGQEGQQEGGEHADIADDDDAISVATSWRSIGSLRSRLHGHEADVFEWMEAQLHRQRREAGLDSAAGIDDRLVATPNMTAEERAARRHARHQDRHGPDWHPDFEELDPAIPAHGTSAFYQMVQGLVAAGYERNASLRGAPCECGRLQPCIASGLAQPFAPVPRLGRAGRRL